MEYIVAGRPVTLVEALGVEHRPFDVGLEALAAELAVEVEHPE